MKKQSEKSLVKFVENIWYHYKWAILITIFFAFVFIICTIQMISNKKPDVFIYHVAAHGITANSVDKLTDSLSEFSRDYNDDGSVTVDFKEEIYIPDVVSAGQGQISVTDTFYLELFAGECVIYIMDEGFYRGNADFMVNLKDVLGYQPEYAYDNKALLLSDLPAYNNVPGLCDLPKESFICVRKERVGINEMDEEIYNNNLDYFRRFIEFFNYKK